MVLQQTDNYIKACIKTWMFCEACADSEKGNNHPKQFLIDKCRACAHSCFTVACQIMNNPDGVREPVLICLLNCRECFEECEKYNYNVAISHCGETCWFCAEMLKDLLFFPAGFN
jgi:hypothetical protein